MEGFDVLREKWKGMSSENPVSPPLAGDFVSSSFCMSASESVL